MQWDDLLFRIREAGIAAVEDDYVEDYGQFASRNDPRLRDRFFRCTFGRVRVDGCSLEAYAFSSESDAEDFRELVGNDSPDWGRSRNMVFHAPNNGPEVLGRVLKIL